MNELVDRFDQGVVYCEKDEVSRLKAELDHKFKELASQTARVSVSDREKEEAVAAASKLAKMKAQLADVASRKKMAH